MTRPSLHKEERMSTENPENGYRVNNPGRSRFTDMPLSRIFDKDGNESPGSG